MVKPFQPGDPSQQLEWADALIRSKQMPNRVLEVTGELVLSALNYAIETYLFALGAC